MAATGALRLSSSPLSGVSFPSASAALSIRERFAHLQSGVGGGGAFVEEVMQLLNKMPLCVGIISVIQPVVIETSDCSLISA